MKNWRYIKDEPRSGAWNMALDEALFTEFLESRQTPVFRLYQWQPSCISLGRFQDTDFLNREYLDSAGIDIVRRFSGGGALFHGTDLSYSIICESEESVEDSYITLTEFLFELYRDLGLNPGYARDSAVPSGGFGERTSLCLCGRERLDIIVQERKIGGNAQRRMNGALIQHGSIPLFFDYDKMTKFCGGGGEIFTNSVSLENLGVVLKAAELAEKTEKVFERVFGRLVGTEITENENRRAEELVRIKFGNSEIINSRRAMARAAGI